jgi:hypothetical protein
MKTFFIHILRVRAYARNRQDPECIHALAEVIWHALLVVGVAVAFMFLAFGGWILVQAHQTVSNAQTPELSIEVLSRQDLRGALEIMDQRQLRYDILRENPPEIVDPSR